jgi:hypothetical protein
MTKILEKYPDEASRPSLPLYLVRGKLRGQHPMTMTTWMGTPTTPTTPTKTAKGKAKKEAEADLDTTREKLTAVMNTESLGKATVVKILKKFGATKSAELEEDDYAGVIKACDAALATVEESEEEEEDV